jgi:hypothetical protein
MRIFVMQSRIFEFRWKDENVPYFRVLQNGVLIEQGLSFQKNVSLEITGMYSCSGYEKNGTYFPCVGGGIPGTRKCEGCKKQEGMSAIQYCDGFNTQMFSGEELEALNIPHYVYLALFDRDLVKVGVSAHHRGFLRQIEQGSHYSLIIAEKMWGIPARQMETLIRKNGMVDKIQSSQKKDSFFCDMDEGEAKIYLENLSEKHLSLVVAQRPELEQYVLSVPIFKTFSTFYRLTEAKSIQKPIHNTDLLPGESLSGTLVAAKGNFLLLETNTECVLLNARKLKGYQVDFSAKPIGLQKETAFQGALF